MSLLKFIIWRAVAFLITFLVITAVLHGVIMQAPVESRAMLYWSSRTPIELMSPVEEAAVRAGIIERYGLDDPYPVQYIRWLTRLLQGEWGWSPRLNGKVIDYLVARTPVTAELTLYTILLFVPLGLISGVLTGWRQGRPVDHGFRLLAFIATSIPPFILGLALLAIFYVGLRWFPIGRYSAATSIALNAATFHTYTGLTVIDGLLNGRPDISLDSARHLALPVITLSLAHWATLGRITRAMMIEELHKEYITVANARGLPTRLILWRHAFRNAILPALTSIGLSAASLITGVYVVEVIFGLHGVSEVLIRSLELGTAGGPTMDAPAALGFAVYSVSVVLLLLFLLDILQAAAHPQVRERLGES